MSQPAPHSLPRFYRGHSMLAFFRRGDYLILQPAAFERIRPGDVVVFRSPERAAADDPVVHRVIAVLPAGLVTRGDTNPRPDSGVVGPENLLGKVTGLVRDGRRRPVWGGWAGLCLGRTIYHLRRLARAPRRFFAASGRPLWGWLQSSRLVARLWRPALHQVRFAAESGPVIKYISGRRVVARWWPQTGRFQCVHPFDLIIPDPTQNQHG